MLVGTGLSIIQGGMGVAVSGWHLARAVSRLGQLGVVSGTALDVVLARRLQLGDPDGDLRRAIQHFPEPAVAERILETYFVEGGKDHERQNQKMKDKGEQEIHGPAARARTAHLEQRLHKQFLATENRPALRRRFPASR